jgi:hypothetical protein
MALAFLVFIIGIFNPSGSLLNKKAKAGGGVVVTL